MGNILVRGMCMLYDEINNFCHLSFDVIVRPKYGLDTLTKSPMHTQVNYHFHFHFSFRSSTVTDREKDRQTCL